jgi:spermidine synthase
MVQSTLDLLDISMNKSQKLFLYTLFFLSGVCGLVYEVVWSRQFLLIFGNTTYSVVGVITSFILGLGIGNYLLGRYADKRKKLVSLYALLEVLVGVFAITTLYSIPIISAFFTYLVQSYSLTPGSLIILKFLLSSAVLFPATICMGGTLPILIRYFSKESFPKRYPFFWSKD